METGLPGDLAAAVIDSMQGRLRLRSFGSAGVVAGQGWTRWPVLPVIALLLIPMGVAGSALPPAAQALPTVSVAPVVHWAAPGRPVPGAPATGPNWSVDANATVAPSPRGNVVIAYDSELRRVVLFGGQTAGGRYFNDTWEFANGTWANVTSQVGHAPPGRSSGVLVDDPVDRYLVLWGGANSSMTFSDTWTFNSTGWHHLLTTPSATPPACYLCNAAWDERDDSVLLFDGYSTAPSAETWTFVAGNWTRVNNTGSGTPGVTEAGGMDFDPNVDGVLYYDDFPGTFGQDGTWSYAAGNWTSYGVVPTPTRTWPGMAYDAQDGYSLLFGGGTFSSHAPYERNDTWAYGSSGWANITNVSGAAPPARYAPGMVYDAADGYIVLFGGLHSTTSGPGSGSLNDTWTYGLFSPGHPSVPTVAIYSNATATEVGWPVAFYAVPGSSGAPPYSYLWEFGDGSSSNAQDTSHIFLQPGNFTVNVTITDADGHAGSATYLENVTTPAAIQAHASPGWATDVGLNVNFIGSTSNGTGPFTFDWSFGDGTRSTGSVASHAFSAPGDYVVWLNVTDGLGGRTSVASIESVAADPGVGFGVPCCADVGLLQKFGAYAVRGQAPYTFGWSFGDGTTAAGANVSHAFPTPGRIPFSVVVTDAVGASATGSGYVNVSARPTACAQVLRLGEGSPEPGRCAASADRASGNTSSGFEFDSFVLGGTPAITYLWTFGDGGNSSAPTAFHNYTQAGNYTAEVAATDDSGLTAVAFVNVTVSNVPIETLPPCSVACPGNPTTGPNGSTASFLGPFGPYLVVGAVAATLLIAAVILLRRRTRGAGPDRETP